MHIIRGRPTSQTSEYLTSTDRLLAPAIFAGNKLQATDWKKAIEYAALQLKHFSGWDMAIVASARMTNEELWLTSQLARQLNVSLIDVVPRHDSGDHILLSQDRNPNINGAKIILGLTAEPGARLKQIADGVAGGRIKALVALGEDPTEIGITVDQLKQLPSFIMTGILHNAATPHTTALFPSAGYAEKRGSMINGRGRLQRLNLLCLLIKGIDQFLLRGFQQGRLRVLFLDRTGTEETARCGQNHQEQR